MQRLTKRIMEHVNRLPEGTPVGARELLHLGTRMAIDQTLSRLALRGELIRVGRGMYVRPVETRFGRRMPLVEAVVRGVAASKGETVALHGAVAANSLGLTTQVPVRTVYLTSGPTRRIKLGAETVELKHAKRWQTLAGPAGEAVRALDWLGYERAGNALEVLRQKLPVDVIRALAEARGYVPNWMAAQLSKLLG